MTTQMNGAEIVTSVDFSGSDVPATKKTRKRTTYAYSADVTFHGKTFTVTVQARNDVDAEKQIKDGAFEISNLRRG